MVVAAAAAIVVRGGGARNVCMVDSVNSASTSASDIPFPGFGDLHMMIVVGY